jgi:hypothetical protein
MLLTRVVAFTLAVLLFAETLEPSWGWYLALWVFCIASFSLVSVAAGFVSFWLMVGLFQPSDAWHTVLAVFTLVAVVQALIRRQTWEWRAVSWDVGETSGGRRRWRRE